MQSTALAITLVLLSLLAACFIWVLRNAATSRDWEKVLVPAYWLRARLFGLVTAAGAVIASATLIPWPHDALANEVTRVVDVTGRQWSWQLSGTEMQVGEVVEFHVSSADVNHDFGLYDPHQRLVAQIQAMPGFTNIVRYKFEQPGRYEVLCLEYCGVAHHVMAAEIYARSRLPDPGASHDHN